MGCNYLTAFFYLNPAFATSLLYSPVLPKPNLPFRGLGVFRSAIFVEKLVYVLFYYLKTHCFGLMWLVCDTTTAGLVGLTGHQPRLKTCLIGILFKVVHPRPISRLGILLYLLNTEIEKSKQL